MEVAQRTFREMYLNLNDAANLSSKLPPMMIKGLVVMKRQIRRSREEIWSITHLKPGVASNKDKIHYII
jgi:hypothetical protein